MNDVPGAAGAIPWVRGDTTGLRIPAHAAALREGGPAFLTEAFRAAGTLAADNHVSRITQCEDIPGGSTGRKLLLAVEYEKPAAGLHRELFVKFSRDFDDPVRDRGRFQMEPEVRFAQLSRGPGFPIVVADCPFADYHAVTGTGLLITRRIAFGRDGIEPHHEKCRDDELPDVLAHYRALLTAVARLAGAHKAGRLPANVSAQFPFDPTKLDVGERVPYTAQQLQTRVVRYREFAAIHPQLLPANIRDPGFMARLEREVARVPPHAEAIHADLRGRLDHVALCHWNANIDNAWFWRGAQGHLECGLLDWGCVSQMNLAMAIWGALSGADSALFDQHFDALLALFVEEYQAGGGPRIDAGLLKRHVLLYAALMGLAWLLDAPRYLQTLVPELALVTSRHDPRLREQEMARCQLQMLTNFLNLWETQDIGRALDEFLAT